MLHSFHPRRSSDLKVTVMASGVPGRTINRAGEEVEMVERNTKRLKTSHYSQDLGGGFIVV
ncbi:hypothetical protein RCL39_25125 [Salmonella enterica subsp. enterica serovar 1,4,[5],12:i:-]